MVEVVRVLPLPYLDLALKDLIQEVRSVRKFKLLMSSQIRVLPAMVKLQTFLIIPKPNLDHKRDRNLTSLGDHPAPVFSKVFDKEEGSSGVNYIQNENWMLI